MIFKADTLDSYAFDLSILYCWVVLMRLRILAISFELSPAYFYLA